MGLVDKLLQCSDCGFSYTFSAQEQQRFATRGYTNEPRRCPLCRALSRARSDSLSGYNTRQQMYPAVCADCGKETEVPFAPRAGRPVYCSRCYDKVRLASRY